MAALLPVFLPQGTGEWQGVMESYDECTLPLCTALLLPARATKLGLVKTIQTGPTVLSLLTTITTHTFSLLSAA